MRPYGDKVKPTLDSFQVQLSLPQADDFHITSRASVAAEWTGEDL